MSTHALIDRLLLSHEDGPPPIEVLHALLDGGTAEASEAPLGIADAAALVGLTPHTLRYYEQQELVRPGRTGAGHRAYGPDDLRRLVFLTRMRVSGMSMRDLRRYVRLVDEGESTVPERRDLMLAQRERIVQQQRDLALALLATD